MSGASQVIGAAAPTRPIERKYNDRPEDKMVMPLAPPTHDLLVEPLIFIARTGRFIVVFHGMFKRAGTFQSMTVKSERAL